MEVLRQPAHPALRRYIRSFGQRRISLAGATITTALPARPDQFIEFYLGERYGISVDGGAPVAVPETTVVGPQTRPGLRLHMNGSIDVFTVNFQPTGFHRLFGVPMTELTDRGVAIADVLGKCLASLEDAVRAAETFDGRILAVQLWLTGQAHSWNDEEAFDHAARLLVAARGRAKIDVIAERAGLSPRQFRRRFEKEVGVTPKFYARTLRLQAALDARQRSPRQSWTTIVHALGYSDQAHFIRDCRILTGDSPARFMALESPATEMFNSPLS